MAKQGSRGKGEKMENGGRLGKWGPRESKGPWGSMEVRVSLGYLDPKDLREIWAPLDQRVQRGRLAFEVTEAFRVLWGLLGR